MNTKTDIINKIELYLHQLNLHNYSNIRKTKIKLQTLKLKYPEQYKEVLDKKIHNIYI